MTIYRVFPKNKEEREKRLKRGLPAYIIESIYQSSAHNLLLNEAKGREVEQYEIKTVILTT